MFLSWIRLLRLSPPIELPAPAPTTSAPVTEVPVPSDAAAASVPTQVVQGDLTDDVVSGVAASSPPLVPCVKAFIYDLILLAVVGVSFVVAAETAMATGGELDFFHLWRL